MAADSPLLSVRLAANLTLVVVTVISLQLSTAVDSRFTLVSIPLVLLVVIAYVVQTAPSVSMESA